jgi:hypothetical protein
MLSESLAEYSSLKVLEQYGKPKCGNPKKLPRQVFNGKDS